MSAPMTDRYTVYVNIFTSFLSSAIPNNTTCGYIYIRCDQQSLQGSKSAISEKNKLPLVAISAMKKEKNNTRLLIYENTVEDFCKDRPTHKKTITPRLAIVASCKRRVTNRIIDEILH